jgi:ribonucrease Y
MVVAVGLAVVLGNARKKVHELQGAIRRKSTDEDEVIRKAQQEADRILANAKDDGRREAEAIGLEARAQLRIAEGKVQEAEARRKAAEVEAREVLLKARDSAENEVSKAAAEQQTVLKELEQRATKRERVVREKEDLLATRELDMTRREKGLQTREQQAQAHDARIAELIKAQETKLQEIAGMSAEDAKNRLMDKYKDEARRDAANDAKRIEDEAREEAEKRAKRIVGLAIQRFAGEYVQDRSVTSVHLPNDELKGRIIGREGRNIRALQEATGVDFIVDDTPETIVVSSFDPIRREVARIALEKLIVDGRIHPTRIEEIVAKSQDEVERAMREAAEQAMLELSITRVHPELVKLLGRLRYRYSYAQNVLRHSVECGFLSGLMAAELGLNVRQARRAGLLHDIGKAVSHEQEGGHAVVGGQLARKFGEDEVVSNAIACHHDDEPCRFILGHLVAAADTLSGARPGARREMLESYVQRLEELERISASFTGVERAYAIQAGREVRVLVEPAEVSDAESALLAREIARKVEDSLTYPGQIRVTVVRETRAIDYAK